MRAHELLAGSILLMLLALSLLVGAADIGLSSWWQWLNPAKEDVSATVQAITTLRVTRTLLAVMTGAALAVGGALMQSLFRNPLAEPGLVGVSAGAALGAALVMFMGALSFVAIGAAAMAGAFLATGAAWVFARHQTQIYGLLLAGVAINALSLSLVTLLTSLGSDTQMRALMFWSMGSFARAPLWVVLTFLPIWFVCLLLAMRSWPTLNALLLGQEQARHVGVVVKRVRWQLVTLTAVLVGPLVSMTGVISFVGLLVPQALRRLLGTGNHKRLLPLCALWGAAVVVAGDILARLVVAPAELPVGIIISLAGAPAFLWLLARPDWR